MLKEKHTKALARLLVVNSSRHRAFVRGLEELEDERTLARIIGALENIVENPQLTWRPSLEARGADTLLLALGFRSPRADGRWKFEARPSPAVVQELSLAIDALRSYRKPVTAYGKPEPEIGKSGTATVLLIFHGTAHRRRFDADDLFRDVVEWAKHIAQQRSDITLVATAPVVNLVEAEDKTLQALGFWPGVTLRMQESGVAEHNNTKKEDAIRTKKKKPKPSEIINAITKNRFGPPPTHVQARGVAQVERGKKKHPAVPAPA